MTVYENYNVIAFKSWIQKFTVYGCFSSDRNSNKKFIEQFLFLKAQLKISMVGKLNKEIKKMGCMTGKYMSTQHLTN